MSLKEIGKSAYKSKRIHESEGDTHICLKRHGFRQDLSADPMFEHVLIVYLVWFLNTDRAHSE